MGKSKNDTAWQQLFHRHGILDTIQKHGFYEITSHEINRVREARLMTKFDHRSQLPAIFADHNLSILPITRGSYLISQFHTFHNFESDKDIPVNKIPFPGDIESLDFRKITSESTAINCAFVTGIIRDFMDEETVYPTVNGRMSSLAFDFSINGHDGATLKVIVKNAQLEIDGGYESPASLALIEAKNYISNDFLIRQLYYPFRLWEGKITKKIRPLFLTYTNGIFHLREYFFENHHHYNSLRLLRQKKYVIDEGETPINLELIRETVHKSPIVPEPAIPFPQADAFERIINLCELLFDEKMLSHDQITSNYDFDRRQTNYYTDAGRYLGFIEKTREDGMVFFSLTPKGLQLFTLDLKARQLALVGHICGHIVFRRVFQLYIEKAVVPTKAEIVEIMKESNLYQVGAESTFYRRASTVVRWVNWIMGLIEE